MHEMSVMAELFIILNNNIEKYNLKKIDEVVVIIGEMTCINDRALKFAFQVFGENTKVEGAKLLIKHVDGNDLFLEEVRGETYGDYQNREENT